MISIAQYLLDIYYSSISCKYTNIGPVKMRTVLISFLFSSLNRLQMKLVIVSTLNKKIFGFNCVQLMKNEGVSTRNLVAVHYTESVVS